MEIIPISFVFRTGSKVRVNKDMLTELNVASLHEVNIDFSDVPSVIDLVVNYVSFRVDIESEDEDICVLYNCTGTLADKPITLEVLEDSLGLSDTDLKTFTAISLNKGYSTGIEVTIRTEFKLPKERVSSLVPIEDFFTLDDIIDISVDNIVVTYDSINSLFMKYYSVFFIMCKDGKEERINFTLREEEPI